ncbi:Serine/threonine-protein kinase/endoribonuclease IRE1b [Striga hermonthica]|uniref:non-specific serine/threonine protein kinase n=1 Tax=Striga hermonthica TaxID=68872 RepID=A0A9N7R202_STRHE|nr:Serine/threonine-protein kinase/endoribonuclease IRE1b [Striga hermonthica]
MRGLFILLFLLALILAVVFGVLSTSDNPDMDTDPDSDNLPLPLTSKHDTAILAAPDGTVYLVEIGSGKILWSFSSGPSIYSSYQQLPKYEGEKLNASAESDNFYIDCGEDWELYLHGTGLKRVKLPVSADEFVKRTPYVSAGGGIVLGSKKTAVFLVDAKTGKVIRTFRSDNIDETSTLTRGDIEEWVPSTVNPDAVDRPLYVTRTDYALKYTSAQTGKVLWYLMFADIEASFQCEGIENFLGGFTRDKKFRPGQGFEMKLPLHCETRPVVYRVRDRSSLEPLFEANGQKGALPGVETLSLPHSSNLDLEPMKEMLSPLHSKDVDRLGLPIPDYDEVEVKSLPGSVTQENSLVELDTGAQSHFWPSMLHFGFLPIAVAFFSCVRCVLIRKQGNKLKERSEDVKSKNVTPKKKKSRKSSGSRHNIVVEKRHVDYLPSVITGDAVENGTSPDVRRIGKLVLSNKEIAKGSNGTVVFEGTYDGRSVAIKRLVRTHHNVAVKEIENLIASDHHPNIVRWHGVEYDQDFVYICLERCTCSMHELILFCTYENQADESLSLVGCNVQLLKTFGSGKELELWKVNGYPSARLLKLMRDIVCGLAHLHELGIVHRDLKPQNVLIIKDRSISAKISDMGISKLLDGEMSSLTKHATGYGSSGWQAPEQLRRERHTRAVDLFSLGCILFFCITGGKHPFGESLERDVNIVNDRKDLFLIDHIPEATDLISRLLDPDPYLRPKATEVMQHPLFWDPEKRLSFLRDASDRVELEDRENGSQLLVDLENAGKAALGGKWDEKMENAFLNDIGRYRRYKFDSVRDLLRVIRNKLNHFRELSKEIQALLGPVPDGFDSYFTSRFPKLLIEVYGVFFRYCSNEEVFHKYFRGSRF